MKQNDERAHRRIARMARVPQLPVHAQQGFPYARPNAFGSNWAGKISNMNGVFKSIVFAAALLRNPVGSFSQVSSSHYASARIIAITPVSNKEATGFVDAGLLASSSASFNSPCSSGNFHHGTYSLPLAVKPAPALSILLSSLPYLAYTVTLPATCPVDAGTHTIMVHLFSNIASSGTSLGLTGEQTIQIKAIIGLHRQSLGLWFSKGVPVTINYN